MDQNILDNRRLSQAWNVGTYHATSNMSMIPPRSARFTERELEVYEQGYKSSEGMQHVT